MKTSSVIASLAVALPTALGYINPAPSVCVGKATCTTTSGNAENAELFENGTVNECLFGHSAIDAAGERCEVPCQANVEYECECLSEQQSIEGIFSDQTGNLIIASVALGFMAMLCGVQCYRRASYSAYIKKHMQEVEEKKDNPGEVVTMYKDPPGECFIWVLHAIALAVMGAFFATFSKGIKEEYWNGC